MPLRILAGIVNISRRGPKNGSVTIGFNPHARTAGTVGVVERSTIGPAGRFASVPAKHVALRQITSIGTDPPTTHRFTVNDTITRDSLRIRWRGTGPSFSEEISYMVIGNIPESVSIPPRLDVEPRPPRRLPPPRRVSRSAKHSRKTKSRKR